MGKCLYMYTNTIVYYVQALASYIHTTTLTLVSAVIFTNLPDLETVSERLKSGYYSCLRLFISDMRRMFINCKTYNDKNTDYFRCALSLEKFYVNKMKEYGLWIELR